MALNPTDRADRAAPHPSAPEPALPSSPAESGPPASGLILGLSNSDYHAHPAIGNSGLTLIARSPAHYHARYLDPSREPDEPTDALMFGTAVHCAVLEPQRFAVEYVAAPKFDRRTKAGKEAAEAFAAQHPGATPLALDRHAACLRIAASVRSNPVLAEVFASGVAEGSIFWTDEETGVECKCRPDFLSADGRICIDLKTTEDARAWAFRSSVARYRYHVEAAHYSAGIAAAYGAAPQLFAFVAIEKAPPYAVALYYATPRMLDRGETERRRNLQTYAGCLASGIWPGYPEELAPLDLPAYAERESFDAV